jgi:CRP-like cAMP-binding protein
MPGSGQGAQPFWPRNRLLQALPAADLEILRAELHPVQLDTHATLVTAGAPVESVHFVEVGTVSMIAALENGVRIEVGLVGPEGMVGLSLLLGAETSGLDGLVQISGHALRMSAASFRSTLSAVPTLLPLLLRYVDTFHYQVSQSAACNSRHPIEQRLARWLLMEHDRNEGDTFTMTQEFLSTMLGVRRSGVTVAVAALQQDGLVEHGRGMIRIDRVPPRGVAAALLSRVSCSIRLPWMAG